MISDISKAYETNLFHGLEGVSDGSVSGYSEIVAGNGKRIGINLITGGAWCQLYRRKNKKDDVGKFFPIGAVSTGSVGRNNRWDSGYDYCVRIIRPPTDSDPVELYLTRVQQPGHASDGIESDIANVVGLALHDEAPLVGAGSVADGKAFKGAFFAIYEDDPARNAYFGGGWDFGGTEIRKLHIGPLQLGIQAAINNYPGTGLDPSLPTTPSVTDLTGKLTEIDALVFSSAIAQDPQLWRLDSIHPDSTDTGHVMTTADVNAGQYGPILVYSGLAPRANARPGRIYVRVRAESVGDFVYVRNETGTISQIQASQAGAWHWRLADITANAGDTIVSLIGGSPAFAVDRILIVDDDVATAPVGALGFTLSAPIVPVVTPATVDSNRISKLQAETWGDNTPGATGLLWTLESNIQDHTGNGYAQATGPADAASGGPVLSYFGVPTRAALRPGRIWAYVHGEDGDRAAIKTSGSGSEGLIVATATNQWHWVEASSEAFAYDRTVELRAMNEGFKVDQIIIVDNDITDIPIGQIGYTVNDVAVTPPVTGGTAAVGVPAAKMIALDASIWSDRLSTDDQSWSSGSTVPDYTESGYAELGGISVADKGAALRWYSLPERASGLPGRIFVRMRAASVGHQIMIRSQGNGAQGQATATVSSDWEWIETTQEAHPFDRSLHIDGRDAGVLIDRIVIVDNDIAATPTGPFGFAPQ